MKYSVKEFSSGLGYSLADHKFIWIWPVIRLCQVLGGVQHIITDINQIKKGANEDYNITNLTKQINCYKDFFLNF